MGKWREVRFNELIQINPSVKLKNGEEYNFIEIAHLVPGMFEVRSDVIKEYKGQSSAKFENGDVLFSRITPCLENRKIAQCSLRTAKGFGSTEFFVFRARNNVSQSYIRYLSQTDMVVLPSINSMTGTSGRQRADKKFIEKIKLIAPDLATQEKIANILSAYDNLIENNTKRIKLLEQAAEELYKEWFVRMRFPGHENTKIVNGIPEGWEVKRLGDFVKLFHGYTTAATDEITNVKFLRGTDINKKKYIEWNEVPCCHITDNEKVKYKLMVNDIVIIRMADPGKIAIIEQDVQAVFASYLIKIGYDKKQVRPYYFFFSLVSNNYQEQILSFSNGTTRSSINSEMIKKSKIIMPPLSLQNEFNDRVCLFRKELNVLLLNNQNLIKQRDILLPRLMNGKLEV